MGIIIKPILTEKANDQKEKRGVYSFRVLPEANKVQIKEAVEEMYKVHVVSVNTLQVEGKKKSKYTKKGWVAGQMPSYKKALVIVKEGESIDFYENI
ncbi:MAG TPA: 50S ribosomal protein L23 [Porphyromonadaceae bacterium]|nr:50S ribosomal protein L23 [Porphyromonadaceae bacterium]